MSQGMGAGRYTNEFHLLKCSADRRFAAKLIGLDLLRGTVSDAPTRSRMGRPTFADRMVGQDVVNTDIHMTSPNGVRILSPQGAITPTGPWSLGTRAGDFVFVAGMRGIDPATNALVAGEAARIRQAFVNMKLIAAAEGAGLRDAVRIVAYVTDMNRLRPLVNKVQEELWGGAPYPPRTILEVSRLNQDDIFEVDGTFYAPVAPAR